MKLLITKEYQNHNQKPFKKLNNKTKNKTYLEKLLCKNEKVG